ncbi:hypothetical protein KC725_00935, partial [Candidatus Peregrinibacteria bacterium]|nr:hypothetical protein [Candidatus Peregrinibacteria bacterium]
MTELINMIIWFSYFLPYTMKTPRLERQTFSVMEVARAELIAGFEKQLGALTDAEEQYIAATINYYGIAADKVSLFGKALLAGEDCETVFPGYREMVQMFLALANSRSYAEKDLDQTLQSMIARTVNGTEIMGIPAITDEEIGIETVDSTIVMDLASLIDEKVNGTVEMKIK